MDPVSPAELATWREYAAIPVSCAVRRVSWAGRSAHRAVTSAVVRTSTALEKPERREPADRVARNAPYNWYGGKIPRNVQAHPNAYLGTSFSFRRYCSEAACGLRLDEGASLTDASILDVGPRGSISVGRFALVSGAYLLCDESISIGDYAMIAWNAVLMDSYRSPPRPGRRTTAPLRIGNDAWIGLQACILPGVSIGEGAIVAARAVVCDDIPAFHMAAGNPAQVVRKL